MTGVQTCALPISQASGLGCLSSPLHRRGHRGLVAHRQGQDLNAGSPALSPQLKPPAVLTQEALRWAEAMNLTAPRGRPPAGLTWGHSLIHLASKKGLKMLKISGSRESAPMVRGEGGTAWLPRAPRWSGLSPHRPPHVKDTEALLPCHLSQLSSGLRWGLLWDPTLTLHPAHLQAVLALHRDRLPGRHALREPAYV